MSARTAIETEAAHVLSLAELAERLRVVEGERDAALQERNYARRQRDEGRECRYPCDCGQFPEEHCACMDGHASPAVAAPETDVRLTEAEREALAHAFVRYSFAPKDWVEVIAPAVERIVAERVRVVEGERAQAVQDAAGWRTTAKEYEADIEAIANRLANAALSEYRAADESRARDMVARAESAEAALAGLRAGVEALADEWGTAHGDPPVDPSHISIRYSRALRALLGGAS